MKEQNLEQIATFAEIPNQRTQKLTPDKLGDFLEQHKESKYKRFEPKEIKTSSFGTLTGDSDYGVRMGQVKIIIAQALYSPDDLSNHFEESSKNLEKYSNQLDKAINSNLFKIVKGLVSIPQGIRAYFDKEFKEDLEYSKKHFPPEKEVENSKTFSIIYKELSEVVKDIKNDFGYKKPEEILELSELNHYFSGKWNGSGRNLTFTDEKMRVYGNRLQQLVQRIWDIGHCEDKPNPLSERELMPVRY